MNNSNPVHSKMSPKSKTAAFLSAMAFAFAALPAAAQSDIQWDRPAPPAYNQNADPYRPLPQERMFSPRQVEALVAPIALFPDTLVAQIMMAATYPYDVEDAADHVFGVFVCVCHAGDPFLVRCFRPDGGGRQGGGSTPGR